MTKIVATGFEGADQSIYGDGRNLEPIICGLCKRRTTMAVTHEVDLYVMLICPECEKKQK